MGVQEEQYIAKACNKNCMRIRYSNNCWLLVCKQHAVELVVQSYYGKQGCQENVVRIKVTQQPLFRYAT